MATETKTHGDYNVGWICALPKEQTAATAMLDKRHGNLPKPPNDSNTYTLGSIGQHNIVIACLPKGKYGTNSAATVATLMIGTFPSIKVGLMVGIGGGIPPKVRLGDVVVSIPEEQFPGVVQWDMGKAKQGGKFERTGALNNPPNALLSAIGTLETEYELMGSKIPDYLDELKQKYPKAAKKYLKSDKLHDVLFKADYSHVSEAMTRNDAALDDDYGEEGEGEEENNDDDSDEEAEEGCQLCDKAQIVKRKRRAMRVHYGLIASGNQVIKDATFRDKLNKDLGGNLLCVEMEAAGMMNNFPCIVIRGICDYCDSHKNKAWQEHAAAVAAAFAKELLGVVQASDVDGERLVKDVLKEVKQDLKRVHQTVEDGFLETKNNLGILLEDQELNKRMDILNWLSPINFAPQQNDYITRCEPGTGQWLLEAREFHAWLATSKQTLFCPGIPGAGKTILTSIVIDNLGRRYFGNTTIGIAYIYCNFRRQEEQKVDNLLVNILKQLVQRRDFLPNNIKDLYNQHQEDKTRPSLEEISRNLQAVAAAYSRVFIIVDALDEYEEFDRSKFLGELFNLQATATVNIFATSRPNHRIEGVFNGCLSLEILASDKDVHRYIDGNMSRLPAFVLGRPDLQVEIKETITKAVEGMFLLAQLYLDSLQDKTSTRDLKDALIEFQRQSEQESTENKNLRTLSRVYDGAMERINKQSDGFRQLAKDVLSWITYAKRQLTKLELQHALAVKIGDESLDKENFREIEDMVSVCAGLVTVDEESNIIRLVHYTTQEYFEQTQNVWFPDAETVITKTCITYLSFGVFESGICQSNDELEQRWQLYCFFQYAAQYWGYHARRASIIDETLNKTIVQFLTSEPKVKASWEGLNAMNSYAYDRELDTEEITSVHLIAYFGIATILQLLFDTTKVELDTQDGNTWTPLMWAAYKGHEDVVQVLLDTGEVEVDWKDCYYRTPLSWAAKRGHAGIVKLLLDTGNVELDSTDEYGEAPLFHAASSGHSDIVKLLVDTGKVKVDRKNNYGQSPIMRAVHGGYESIVKLLLDVGEVDIDEKDNGYGMSVLDWAAYNGHKNIVELLFDTRKAEILSKDSETSKTRLFWAAKNGYADVVQLLLDTGKVEVDSKDHNGWTPLFWASDNRHIDIVQLLLNTGKVEVDSKDQTSRTPLSWVSGDGHIDIVQLLLDTGKVEVDSKDHNGWTPLSWASLRGHTDIVQLLLDTGKVEVDSKDQTSRTPLSWASGNGHTDIVQLLLNTGKVEVDSKDQNSRTSLSWASWRGHTNIVQLLLDIGQVEVDSKDHNSRTPLSWASNNGHTDTVQLLLDIGKVEVDSKDHNGRTPLSWAAEKEHEGIVELLLGTGKAEIDSKDYNGRTPLSWATANCYGIVVRLLLNTGKVEVDSKDNYNRTPLSWASENGRVNSVKLLLDTGKVEVNSKDHDGRTPLSWAAEKKHKGVVELLLGTGKAEIDSKDHNSRTPLYLAFANSCRNVVQLLLATGKVEIDFKDPNGCTLLSWAAQNGYKGIVQLLLASGKVEVDSKCSDGWTPLSWAASKGYADIVQLLLDTGKVEIDSKDSRYSQTPLSWAAKNGHKEVVQLLLASGKVEVDSKCSDGRTPMSWAAENGHKEVVQLLLASGKVEVDLKDSVGTSVQLDHRRFYGKGLRKRLQEWLRKLNRG